MADDGFGDADEHKAAQPAAAVGRHHDQVAAARDDLGVDGLRDLACPAGLAP